MVRLENIIEKKSTLFSIVLLVTIGMLAVPIILPHLFHGFHLVHISLHVGGITLSIFITILAVLAYQKLKTKRLLITSIAFGIFITAEFVLLIDATWPKIYDFSQLSLLEVGHVLTISTLGLLAFGVFKND